MFRSIEAQALQILESESDGSLAPPAYRAKGVSCTGKGGGWHRGGGGGLARGGHRFKNSCGRLGRNAGSMLNCVQVKQAAAWRAWQREAPEALPLAPEGWWLLSLPGLATTTPNGDLG